MSAVVHHPRAVELIERRKLRQQVERVVSRLIAILDDLDGDTEAEPWLGASIVLYPQHDDQRLWAACANDDREKPAGDARSEVCLLRNSQSKSFPRAFLVNKASSNAV